MSDEARTTIAAAVQLVLLMIATIMPRRRRGSADGRHARILLALADRELHGYAIRADVLDRTGGRVRLWPAVLYGSLRKLAEAGLVEETDPPEAAPGPPVRRRDPALLCDTETLNTSTSSTTFWASHGNPEKRLQRCTIRLPTGRRQV